MSVLRMLRLLPLLAVLAVLGVARAAASAVDDSGSPASAPGPLLATSGGASSGRLFFVDPVSLRRVGGKSLRLGFNWGGFARSPDGSLLALSRNDRRALRFVRLPGLRFAGSLSFSGGGYVQPVAWLSRRLLLALSSDPTRVIAVDPVARTVLWQRAVPGAVDAFEQSSRGIVVVTSPEGDIGPAILSVVDADGDVRSVKLHRISVGLRVPRDSENRVAERREPGLAIDPVANRAYVVGGSEPVAEVQLETMSVAYHGGSRAVAKAVAGWSRQAIYLGHRRLAIVGANSEAHFEGEQLRQTFTPSGLLLFDSIAGPARLLQASAGAATATDGSLLAYGAGYDSVSDTSTGSGLTAYSSTGTKRFHLFGRTPISLVHAQAGLVYAWLPDRTGHIVVLDEVSGHIVANVTRPEFTLLIRD